MAFVPRSRSPAVRLNLTPMIDVSFQLLVFFVCANTWSHVESAEKLPLPSPIASARAPAPGERPRLTINVRRGGEFIVAGQELPRDRLTELLKRDSRRHGERLEVLIRAHKDVPFGRTREVFEACGTAGVKSVRFAVLKTKE